MGGRRVRRILCAAEPRGSAGPVEQLLRACRDADAQAVAIVGDIGGGDDRTASYRAVLHALGHDGRPAFWLPGPGDAPLGALLREAHSMEVVHPSLHGVHGTPAFADEHVVVAGLGGQVSDDPDAPRDEQLGRTLVVAPGALGDGHYAIAHVHDRTAVLASFATAASSV